MLDSLTLAEPHFQQASQQLARLLSFDDNRIIHSKIKTTLNKRGLFLCIEFSKR
jgi:hypothetical protein